METRHGKSGVLLMHTLDRFVQMRSVLLAIILFLGLAIPAYAATIFTEDYEVTAGDITSSSQNKNDLQNRGWEVTPNCNAYCTFTVVTSPVHGGTKALRMAYVGSINVNGVRDDSHNAKLFRDFSGVPDLYERYWVRFERIDPSQPQEEGGKQHYYNVASGGPSFYSAAWMFSNPSISVTNQSDVSHTCPNGSTDITCNLFSNVGSVPLTFNTWYCVENHLGQGVLETWVNGTRTIHQTAPSVVTPSAYISVQVYRQHGSNHYRYEDDFVMATTRVGCSGGSPSADITPPAPPSGLSVR